MAVFSSEVFWKGTRAAVAFSAAAFAGGTLSPATFAAVVRSGTSFSQLASSVTTPFRNAS